MSRYKRLVVLSDIQSPFHLPQCIALCIEYIKRFKPDLLVLNGDIVDFYTASDFNKVGRGPARMAEEIKITQAEVLEPILAALPKGCQVVWTAGNHEFRLKRAIALHAPWLKDFPGLTIEEAFEMKKLGIRYVDSNNANGIFWITPHLVAMHGTFTTMYAARKYCETIGKSVIYGHTHKEQYWRDTKALTGQSTIAIGAGCLCKDPDEFNSLARYDRGFIAGWYDSQSGMFDIGHRRIAGPNNTILFSDYGLLKARKVSGKWVVDGAVEESDTVVPAAKGQHQSPAQDRGAAEGPRRVRAKKGKG